MIQGLFAVVFLSVLAPVFIQVVRERQKAEAALAAGGIPVKVILAVVFILFALAQERIQTGIPGVDLLNYSVLGYLFGIPIHEFGHFLFMPVGEMPMVLGGSLFQFALPAGLAAFFIYRRCPLLGCIFIFLAGHELIYIGYYMSSAHDPSSTLLLSLEQDPKTHDWFRLFGAMGLLDKSEQIGQFTRVFAMFLIGLSIAGMFLLTAEDEQPA